MKNEHQDFFHKMLADLLIVARSRRYLLVYTVLLGVVGALSAQLFLLLLRISTNFFLKTVAGYQAPILPSEGGNLLQIIGSHGLWIIPVVTTIGGLISGVLVYSIAPEAEGHGTDAAVKAFHQASGFIRARVPPLKMIASAITIGSGGSAGREGPTAQFSAGIASVFATFTNRTVEERRLLVLVGMAAGLSAIFRSPIGTAFFAVEVLYGGMEFEAGAMLYTMLGSIVAYTVNGLFVGFQPLFQVPASLGVSSFEGYLWYIPLGIAAGLVATAIPPLFYGVRDLFKALRIPPHFKPAIGGLIVGLIGLVLPQAIGGGYGWIQEAIDGKLAVDVLLLLALVKIITFSLTISSGGSGGVFGPSLFVGAMLGGFLGRIFHQPEAAFAVVGMAAVFGGTARVPIATLLMVTEMTSGYSLFVPAALAVVISYLVQGRLAARLKYKSLYEAQVLGRTDSPVHYAEALETALRVLNQHKIDRSKKGLSLNMEALLTAGIPIKMADGRQMVGVTVFPDSDLVGRSIAECLSTPSPGDVQVVIVLRENHIVIPASDFKFLAEDKLMAIVTETGKDLLANHEVKPSITANE
jgi:CIC family chloride channel protein